jgi:hypothetical protein
MLIYMVMLCAIVAVTYLIQFQMYSNSKVEYQLEVEAITPVVLA